MDFDKLYSSGLHCPEPDDVTDVAKQLAVTLPENLTLLLDGFMGAGKTFFASALAHALGVKEQVSSPTYDIVNVYASPRRNLVHVDAYRLELKPSCGKSWYRRDAYSALDFIGRVASEGSRTGLWRDLAVDH